MSTVKYRAWMPKEKKWYKGGAIQLTTLQGNTFGLSEANGKIIQLQQWTGLTDRHGKEIYEGDIMAMEPSYYRKKDGTHDKRIPESQRWQQVQVVEWGKWRDFSGGYEAEPGEFYGWSIDPVDLEPPVYSSEHSHGLEVIGNIYENPHLLKQEQN